ncbi:MAG TPA: hypothetical protein VFW39_08435 [Sphingomicrobium sp.]|nr:hypothetical protein [Sphingomicrobium sp.]
MAILPALLTLAAANPIFTDPMNDAAAWPARGSDQVSASSRTANGAIVLSYDFDGVNGYAYMRRSADIALPRNFEVRFRMRGYGGRNDIQFKLTSGGNVWWKVWRNRRPSANWEDVVIPADDLSFAWGPASDHRLSRADGIELVVARDRDGGAGTIAIGKLQIIPLAGEPKPVIAGEDQANSALEAIARAAPRGAYPRAFVGEQPYWTLAGSDGHGIAALIDEDGAIEFDKGGYSIAPVVGDHGKTFDWANVTEGQRLAGGRLPIPTVEWSTSRFDLQTTLLADYAGRAAYAVYTLTNRARSSRVVELRLQLRPWQVNPPSQFLAQKGGASPISAIQQSGNAVTVVQPGEDGDEPARRRLLVGPGAAFRRIDQPASAGAHMAGMDIVYRLRLAAGAARRIVLAAPAKANVPPFDTSLSETLDYWRGTLGRVAVTVPPAKQPFADSLASALAYVLMSRDGPILRPGTRSYDRAWIRDGAMMSEALLRMGRADVARAFADWYGTHQFRSGKVPCCVDFRGGDPVPENDSQGEYIYLVSELYRLTHDRAALEREWPRVLAAVRYMDELRLSERTRRVSDLEFGLMPASISHEGYSAKPQFSLWDDFWALRGYRDAAALALVSGSPEAGRISASRDQFAADLHSAILASRDHWKINFIPGATSLGDFDPTSTTIALDPANDQGQLDPAMLDATFGRYWKEFRQRAAGTREWSDYTPYEIRIIGAFVRLGWRNKIDALLHFFMPGRRPEGWNQWAEVVGRDPRKVRFIGDMPHAWVESDFIRSALDMFAWDRRDEEALVLGGGLSESWLSGRGSAIRGLVTPYGSLDFSMRGNRGNLVALIGGAARPPGGFVIAWPFAGSPPPVLVDGQLRQWPKAGLRIRSTGRPIRISVAPTAGSISRLRMINKDA